MQSNNCIYTKHGDSPNVARSTVKTITIVENNTDNKKEAGCISHMNRIGETLSNPSLRKTPKACVNGQGWTHQQVDQTRV
jgi:hypothetical protein